MIISSEAKKKKLVLTFSDDDANYSQGTTIDSAPDSKTKSSYPFHQNNWRNMIISNKAKDQKLILIWHIMIKLALN